MFDQGQKTKFYTGAVPEGFVLDEGDLVVAMTEQDPGLLGSSAWVLRVAGSSITDVLVSSSISTKAA
jgi:hypothetical protein